jgi:hypothetical protein
MKTDDLINALAADNRTVKAPPGRSLMIASALAVLAAGTLLMLTMGVRPDFAAALATVRFPFKFVVTIALAATTAFVFWGSLFPAVSRRPPFQLLLIAPAILLLGVVAELIALPPDAWLMSAQGKNAVLCLTVIPALGAVPLALMLWVIRQGATTQPVFSGLCAGLLAGAIAATFYAANCTDDSPLFVAVWYPIAIATMGAIGAILGRKVSRW